MAEGTRSYSSPLRADQARTDTGSGSLTLRLSLFAERGYTGTTVDAVAAAAGVSRKTVFDSIGGKALLDEARERLCDRRRRRAGGAQRQAGRSPEFSPSQTMASSWPGTRLSWSPSIAGSQPSGELSRAPPASDAEAGRLYSAMVVQRRHSMQEAAQLFADAGASAS